MVYVYIVLALASLAGSFVAGALYGRAAYAKADAEKKALQASAVKFINKL